METKKESIVKLNTDISKKETSLLQLKKKKLELLKKRKSMESVLPHIYFPMYPWQRQIYDSTNRTNLLTAANQIGKSSAMIRRVIANCTDPTRWPSLWGKGAVPKQFWYFYPDSMTSEREVDMKWIPEWLPRGEYEKHPQYGWKLTRRNGSYHSCSFNAGPTIYFQMYTKKVSNIQAGTVHEIFVDEELPMELYDEIMFRLTATAGIFTMGFTPTLNQLFWKQTMESNKHLPSALKLTISMYDCLKYEDGSPSRVMTLDKIKAAEEKCKNKTEQLRRVYGKFITEEGRIYYAFEYHTNMVARYSVAGYNIYAAADYGSGTDENGVSNHPAAIVFIAVRPDYKRGVVIKSWRGDGSKTTAGDVFLKYQELSAGMRVVQACYDAAAIDFGTIATRNGVSFIKADKTRGLGEDLVNTLFKHKMLEIFQDESENEKLAQELSTVMQGAIRGNTKRGDDLADALRYCCKLIPWDLTAVDEFIQEKEDAKIERKSRQLTEQEFQQMQVRMRRGEDDPNDGKESNDWTELEDEFDYWNAEYG